MQAAAHQPRREGKEPAQRLLSHAPGHLALSFVKRLHDALADRLWRTVQGMLRITYGRAPAEKLSTVRIYPVADLLVPVPRVTELDVRSVVAEQPPIGVGATRRTCARPSADSVRMYAQPRSNSYHRAENLADVP